MRWSSAVAWAGENGVTGENRGKRCQEPFSDQIDPASPTTTYFYDAASNLIATLDALHQTQRYRYDNLYRRTVELDEVLAPVTYTYDLVGNLLMLTDPPTASNTAGNTTSWLYDGLNRVIEEENEVGDSRSFEYDLVGNLIRRTDRNDRVTEFDYDDLYRRTGERWLDSQQQTIHAISYAYDVAGRTLSTSDANGAYTYGYDELDRTTSIAQDISGLTPDIDFMQSYDLMNNRTELVATIDGTADFATDYTYDGLYRVTSIRQHGISGGNSVAENLKATRPPI